MHLHMASGCSLYSTPIFIIFAFSFTRPKTARDWRSLGSFAAFIVALFTEMYGFPLTIYLLSGLLGSRYPGLDLLSHDAGHLWYTLLGLKGDPHLGLFHITQYDAFILVMLGFLIQWPTMLTLLMFPILVWNYVRLAKQEERNVLVEFGEEYSSYMSKTPGFIPRLG